MWIITDKDYAKLRLLLGQNDLVDLDATKTDAVHIQNLAKGLGITDDRIYRNEGATVAELNATYRTLSKISTKLNGQEEEHTLIVYVGGHGATYRNEQQIYLTNSDNVDNVQYQIEYKLCFLVKKDVDPRIKVMAIFDCCRTDLSNYPGLLLKYKGHG